MFERLRLSRSLFFWCQDLGTKILVPKYWYHDLGIKIHDGFWEEVKASRSAAQGAGFFVWPSNENRMLVEQNSLTFLAQYFGMSWSLELGT